MARHLRAARHGTPPACGPALARHLRAARHGTPPACGPASHATCARHHMAAPVHSIVGAAHARDAARQLMRAAWHGRLMRSARRGQPCARHAMARHTRAARHGSTCTRHGLARHLRTVQHGSTCTRHGMARPMRVARHGSTCPLHGLARHMPAARPGRTYARHAEGGRRYRHHLNGVVRRLAFACLADSDPDLVEEEHPPDPRTGIGQGSVEDRPIHSFPYLNRQINRPTHTPLYLPSTRSYAPACLGG